MMDFQIFRPKSIFNGQKGLAPFLDNDFSLYKLNQALILVLHCLSYNILNRYSLR